MAQDLAMQRLPRGADTALIVGAALVLFCTSVLEFRARPTDISALRVLAGDVPYRDFWTMYAPGSFVTLAGAFSLFGRELIVSNVLGILTSAAAVAVFHRLAKSVAGPRAAACLAGLVTLALYGTNYHSGFTSYPPVLLLILGAVSIVAARCVAPGWRWAILPGAILGLAALYKHDIAGYAAITTGAALVFVRANTRAAPVWKPVLALAVSSAVVPLAAVWWLVAHDAGPDLWDNLIRFPLVDFRHVRGETFPLIPRFSGSKTNMVMQLRQWAICNLPSVGIGLGLWGVGRRWSNVTARVRFVAAFATGAFCLHWIAAHVQMNTNAISLAAWGTLAGGIGLWCLEREQRIRLARLALPVLVLWGALFVAPPVNRLRRNWGSRAPVDLPGLRGIRVDPGTQARLVGLAEAIGAAAPAEAPLLLVSNRNDVVVIALTEPYWLSRRRPATRHHELHPGVTDTEPVQRRMLAGIARGERPVVVRDFRFDDAALDRVKAVFLEHVPVGSQLLDEWVAEHYTSGRRFGAFELMEPKADRPIPRVPPRE